MRSPVRQRWGIRIPLPSAAERRHRISRAPDVAAPRLTGLRPFFPALTHRATDLSPLRGCPVFYHQAPSPHKHCEFLGSVERGTWVGGAGGT